MKRFTLFCCYASTFLIIFMLGECPVFSQSRNIDWDMDTVSSKDAKAAQDKFASDLQSFGRKSTPFVTFEISKLKEILDICDAKGVTNVQFMIATLRADDTEKFARRWYKRHPKANFDKKDLVGRQTLIIKVPRAAFFADDKVGTISSNHPLMISLLAAGLVRVEKPPFPQESLYFSIGTLCPPPDVCD